MAGEDEDSFALIARREVMLQPVVADKALRRRRSVMRHLAELGEQPTEIPVELAQNPLPLGCGFLREDQGQITMACATQTWGEDEGQTAYRGPYAPGNAPR